MLRIVPQTSSAAAKNYYTQADYYTEGQELVGHWGGRGAELLGLQGQVDKASFDRLCDNRHPLTGEALTARTRANRRVGWDFNFHAPKSVSVLYGLTQDGAILEAFRAAVNDTMGEIEVDFKTRVRRKRKKADRLTGKSIFAEFIHFTSRPVGLTPDPHLHAHVFTFNATFDHVEDRWKAAEIGDIKRDAPYFQAAFHARLAKRLSELGYGVERTRKGWELTGVPAEVLRTFSKRTEQIERIASARGIHDAEAKARLGSTTREAKRKPLGRGELLKHWVSQLTDEQKTVMYAVIHQKQGARSEPDAVQALAHAARHGFERASVLSERQLLAEALRFGVGSVTVDGAKGALDQAGFLRAERNGERLVTSREVLAEEQKLVAFARGGRGTCKPLGKREHGFRRGWLNEGQKAAVRHVLESGDRVILIRGAAGTGKTSMMQEAVEGIEENGKRVYAFAPTAEASRGVLRREGFGGAETVARLLQDEDLQREVAGQVIWVDEAGLLGTLDMGRLMGLADRFGARVVLSGDRRQHGSVARGAALRLLEDEAGLVPAEIAAIQRQKRGEYKAAVQALGEGRTAEGFAKLCALGWVEELPAGEREQRLATDYAEALREGKSCLVVCPTHAEGGRVSAAIREELRSRGAIGGEEREFLRLESANLTEAERADPVRYEGGDVLEFHRSGKGFKTGQRFHINDPSEAPTGQAACFQVYQPGRLPLAAGDAIRITRNGKTLDGAHRLNNGAIYHVRGFTAEGNITLENGWVVGKEFGHWAHGYVVTSHASQGKTVDRVLVVQGSESFPASSREQFYVSCSRARESAHVYCDDKEGLLKAVERSDPRMSATELVREQAGRQRGLQKHVAFLQRLASLAGEYARRQVGNVQELLARREPAYER